MSKVTTDAVSAVQVADIVRVVLQASVCDECEDVCYSNRIEASSKWGDTWATTLIFYRAHCALAEALSQSAAMAGSLGSRIRKREQAAWLLEHQETLPL